MFKWLFGRLWASKRAANAGPALESAKMTVRQGRRYKAVIVLGGFEQLVATNEAIAGKLTEVGFKEVKVTGDGGRRPAEGIWGKPATTASLDPHLTNIVEMA